MDDLSATVLALLGLAALAAGFVDAVVGGGGLIQLPALLLGHAERRAGADPGHQQGRAFCGTTVSAATYYRRIRPDPRTFLPLMVLAFVGLRRRGALVASQIPREAFEPIVLVALIVVGGYVLLQAASSASRPRSGSRATGTCSPRWRTGLVIGFYDGALGPGTGSFFVITLVGLMGYSFLEASAKAKLANWATNLAAILVFAPQGAIVWKVAVVMGALQHRRRVRRRAHRRLAAAPGSSGSSSSSSSRRSS